MAARDSRNVAGIFVSYRRDETTAYAGWLADRLGDHFGEENVFRDIGSIEPGMDFVEAIESALEATAVMLVVIGKSWRAKLEETSRTGQQDYARLEVATALKRNVRVIPVLVQGASIPRAEELPTDLAPLARRNAIEMHDTNWQSDVQRLVAVLKKIVEEQGGAVGQQDGAVGQQDGEKTRWPHWILMAGLVGALAVMGLGVVAWLQVPANEGEDQALKVPSLKGQKLEAARQTVGEDFELVTSEKSNSQAKGVILSQDPRAGTEIQRGKKISVVVSTGPDTVGQTPTPAPGYVLVEDPTGSLTVQSPTDWTVLKGSESEYPPGTEVRNWSKFLDEDITSSMTAAADLEGYLTGGALGSGMYIVASKTLAQRYTAEGAIYNAVHNASDPTHPNLDNNCEAGATEDLGRPGWSGQVQTWQDCRGAGITNFLVAATPEGGECMVFMHFKMASEADREIKEHMLNTFEVDCGGIANAKTKDQRIVELARANERIPPG